MNGDREIMIFLVQLTEQDWQPYPVDPYSSEWVWKKRGAYYLAHDDLKNGITRYWNYLEDYWPCAGGLSAVNVIGRQLR